MFSVKLRFSKRLCFNVFSKAYAITKGKMQVHFFFFFLREQVHFLSIVHCIIQLIQTHGYC